jgi:hypothetical protein
MNQASRKSQPAEALQGLSESERKALAQASGNNEGSRAPDDLMARAYAKTGIDPLQASAMRDPNRMMAKIQGPIIALGGFLLAAVGLWRIWNAWSNSAISIGGIAMFIIGLLGFVGGLAGTMMIGDEE